MGYLWGSGPPGSLLCWAASFIQVHTAIEEKKPSSTLGTTSWRRCGGLLAPLCQAESGLQVTNLLCASSQEDSFFSLGAYFPCIPVTSCAGQEGGHSKAEKSAIPSMREVQGTQHTRGELNTMGLGCSLVGEGLQGPLYRPSNKIATVLPQRLALTCQHQVTRRHAHRCLFVRGAEWQ